MTSIVDHANPDLLERLPLAANTILDVGCRAGALGAAFRALNPKVRLFGIDHDAAAIAIAATTYDEVACVDIDRIPAPFGAQRFDCIVYGDVLEHLRDPWQVLRAHAELLTEDGMVLVCVPNVEHWSFVARILRGDWDYDEAGLFDATHLRWFNLVTMHRSLHQAGLHACDINPRIFETEGAGPFFEAMRPSLQQLGINADTYAQRAVVLQYVWRAVKTMRPRLTVAASMLHPVGGVSDLRIVHPQMALKSDPLVTTVIGQPGIIPGTRNGAPVEGPSVIILHRPALVGDKGLATLRRLVAEGWIVIVEFDDHPDHFEVMQSDENWTFVGAHALQTSTEPMAEILRASNPEVRVFPNAIRQLPAPRNFQDPDRVTVFFGALNREQDWQPLMPAINDLIAIAGERLHFSVVHDEGFFNALNTTRKSFTPICDYATYLTLLGECEISLMPLADNWFNRAKSDLKFIEAGACRVAALASPTVYEGVVEDGVNGLIFQGADDFRTKLYRLIAVPEDALALAEAARAYVTEQRMLAYQVQARLDWYRDLWERRDQLNQALMARMPMLLPQPQAAQ